MKNYLKRLSWGIISIVLIMSVVIPLTVFANGQSLTVEFASGNVIGNTINYNVDGNNVSISNAKGEVVPLMSDNLFKKVYADTKHLERLNYLLSSIFDKEVKVIKILNNELIGGYY